MASFVELQSRFIATEFAALGYSSATAQIFQPAATLPAANDQSLWTYFNALPQDGLLSVPGPNQFFSAYKTVINALVAGTNPLDPIAAAKRRLAEWGDAPPTWNVGYSGMMRQLAAAPRLAFNFRSDADNDPGFWGLWGQSLTTSDPSAKFAAGNVTAQVAFAHNLNFAPFPGDWYVSSALSLAYANRGGAPWDPKSPVTWQSTFGPHGTMQRFVAGLTIASSVQVDYRSTATFDAAEQAAILAGQAAGMWPYYLKGSEANMTLQFDSEGRLEAKIATARNAPIIIAAAVLSAAQFLGS